MKSKITRRQAIAAGVAIAATSTLSMPTEAATDPIMAMFEDRNRLFLKSCKVRDRMAAVEDAIDARYPNRPAPGIDRIAEREAWEKTEEGRRYKREIRELYKPLEDQFGDLCEAFADADCRIIDTPAATPTGLGIKLWIGVDWADLFDDDASLSEPADAALLAALHDHCRLHGLKIVGPVGKLASGYRIVGSNKGEPVS